MSNLQYDLLAGNYLCRHDLGDKLASLVRFVAKYHREAGDLGRRRARRADLAAAASAGRRLLSALDRLDGYTLVAALKAEFAVGQSGARRQPKVDLAEPRAVDEEAAAGRDAADAQDGGAGIETYDVTSSRTPEFLGELERMRGQITTLTGGLAKLADATPVKSRGGQPPRHDALQFGLESLAHLWTEAGRPPPTMSFKEKGFGALAIILFAKPAGPFETETVRGAVVAFVRGLQDLARQVKAPVSK